MQSLKISLYKSGGFKKPAAEHIKPDETKRPEKEILLPLSTLPIGLRLLPRQVKVSLAKEGIDLMECSDLDKEKDVKGTLIEIDNGDEMIIISIL